MGIFTTILATIAANVASKAISNKINPPPEQKPNIGPGTSPTVSAGPSMEISPIEGSQVQEFGDFSFEDSNESALSEESEYILQALAQAGIDPNTLNEQGIAGMYLGGYLNRAHGGSLKPREQRFSGRNNPYMPDDFMSAIHNVDFTELEQKPEDLFEESMRQAESNSELMPNGISSESIEPLSKFQKAQDWVGKQDPMLQNAIYSGLGSIGQSLFSRLFGDNEDPKGSSVRTKTLPGNSNRRRAALDIKPVSGSSVSFANGGSVLKRPMFMPSGGAMYGPGGPKDDLIPVMASNGEYMLSKAAVDAAGDGSHAQGIARLNAFNGMGNKRYG